MLASINKVYFLRDQLRLRSKLCHINHSQPNFTIVKILGHDFVLELGASKLPRSDNKLTFLFYLYDFCVTLIIDTPDSK